MGTISVLDKVLKPGVISIDCPEGRFQHELDYLDSSSPRSDRSVLLDLAFPLYYPSSRLRTYDRSPYRNIGTIYGAIWEKNNKGFWVLVFDGDDYITINSLATQIQPLTIGTIEVWVGMASDTPGAFFSASDVSDADSRFVLYYSSVLTRPYAYCAEAGALYYNEEFTNATMLVGIQYHVVLTHNGTTPALFFNGVNKVIGAGALDYTKFLVDILNIDDVSLGVNNTSGGRELYLDGDIGKFRFHNRVLAVSEAARNHLATKARYN